MMSYFYFFKHDGECSWMRKEIIQSFPRYLHNPIEYNGKMIKFYVILEWVFRKNKGANLDWVNEIGVNYVDTLDDLPDGAGIYTTGYDVDLQDLKRAHEQGIPIIENPCPWIRQLRKQLLEANNKTHQLILMIDKGHMVYDCYQSAFPDDIIIVNRDNFRQEIDLHSNNKPKQLLCYAAFREKDVLQVVEYIEKCYPSDDNILNGYKKSLCIWTKQGLFEEIDSVIRNEKLNEIWIICSSEYDRSTKSIISQVMENGIQYLIIKDVSGIPENVDKNKRIGVVKAPIPLSTKTKNILNVIKDKIE